ncbi:unnamed protein product [Lactuca saligna]|uniref:AAA+ ATPase domain-containing protein n=1 Tax=Lactuca saligna TaxID=75948 RepID=A0AA35Y1F7_LACSI|nr:unnamed protein product [Lactuca saligna]
MIGDAMTNLGSVAAGLMFLWTIFSGWLPTQFRDHVEQYVHRVRDYVYPYIDITFHEYEGDEIERSKAYAAIERFLSTNSSDRANRLRAKVFNDNESVVLSMDENVVVIDDFQDIKIWWTSKKNILQHQPLYSKRVDEEKRYYKLTCRREHRDTIKNAYLQHVLHEGKAIAVRTRQRKLYTNNKSENIGYGNRRSMWSHIIFEHPSTFDTLAMDPVKKEVILDDLRTFSESKDYYKKVGKSWKRGYLLHGPPGTGKSSMIAAMANLLEYDIYDLELSSVKDNTDLRKLLIETSSKSIIVIEDIDCSLDLTGQRKKKNEENKDDDETIDPILKKAQEEKEKNKGSEVTLSGLLNFVDGLWSACGSERLIVFTTNFLDKLDVALTRRGRMDMHIELSYCCFEAFKVLAKNYMDLESHELFGIISGLLKETNITPADVAEDLIRKSAKQDVESCLKNLINSLKKAKEEARLKAVKDARMKDEAGPSSC